MDKHSSLDPPTHVLGLAVELVVEINVGVTTAATLRSWRPGDVVRLPALAAEGVKLRAGRHVVADADMVVGGEGQLELHLKRVL